MYLRQFVCLFALLVCLPASAVRGAPPPNFIVILVDDLGWSDLGCTGSGFYETPQIDRLAAAGMKFTQAYSACTVCSPTRAALLTGKYPARLHVTDWIKGHARPKARLKVPDWTMHLPRGETTVAEALRAAGYATASIGKWHLGGPEDSPEQHGFDVNIAGTDRGQPPSYFAPYKIPTLKEGPPGEYLTDRETDEAIRFLDAHRDKPFFLYLPRYTVHTPLQAKPELIEKYRRKSPAGGHAHATYAAMIESLDESVGRLMAKLDELKLSERTVVIFTSDNGGLTLGKPPTTSNAPLRAGKGSAYEGGVRVPLLVRWPGTVSAGSSNAGVVITMDIFPTLLELAGVPSAAIPAQDGVSLAPLLRQGGGLQREAVYWHYPHYHPGGATPYSAVRAGEFKLIEFFETGWLELYNLRDDPGEARNLANQLPDQRTRLHARLKGWRESVGAQLPAPNPDWDGQVEPAPLAQAADGTILLHARDVEIHGANVRYEPQTNKNTIGYWSRRDDWVSWDFQVSQPGAFTVEAIQGCGKGSGGSEVEFILGAQTLRMTVQDTGHFQNFIPRELGRFTIEKPGRHMLAVRPLTKPGAAVMDLRQVLLRPVGR